MTIELIELAIPYGLRELSQAGFQVCMTGSRILGGATKESDWDCFIQDTPRARAFLGDAWTGFSVVPESELYTEQYDDAEIALLYRSKDRNSGAVVDIQLVKSYDLKKAAQLWIQATFPLGYLKRLGKTDAKYIWKLAYQMARQG